MPDKRCGLCGQTKALTEFYVKGRAAHLAEQGRPGGYQSRCKPCSTAARRPARPCSGCGKPCKGERGLCRTCNRGEGHQSWRGGRILTPKGYALVLMPDHPRRSARGYVSEHIVVMERTLGRAMLPGENVHHRNGIRDDNRPENLELWVKCQPSGVRVEDALAWAREIIARYG